MDHPDENWSEIKVGDRIEKVLLSNLPIDRDIRFLGLKVNCVEDYMKCFIWEYCRTLIFKGESLSKDENYFPFYISSFPDKAYLDESHPYEMRSKWELFLLDVSTHEHNDNLLIEALGTIEEIRISLSSFNINENILIPAEKVPITIHIDPNWSRSKMKRLFSEQVDGIASSVGLVKKAYEDLGHNFIDPKQIHELKTLKSNLKILGHYRLNQCVNLSDPLFRDSYGKGKFKSERRFRESCSKSLANLPLH